MNSACPLWFRAAISMVIAFMTVMNAGGPATAETLPLTEDEIGEIDADLASRAWMEDRAERFAERFGARAVPHLLELLERSPEGIAKGKVCAYLAKIARPDGPAPEAAPLVLKAISRVIDAGHTGAMTDAEWGVLQSAVSSIGFLGTTESVAYLRTLMTTEFWTQHYPNLSVPELKMTPEKAIRLFRGQAVQAVGLTYSPAVEEALSKKDFPADIPPHYVEEAVLQATKRKTGQLKIEQEKYQTVLAAPNTSGTQRKR